jgi:predicted ATPase
MAHARLLIDIFSMKLFVSILGRNGELLDSHLFFYHRYFALADVHRLRGPARPPGLLVLNEPETSLHPDLLPALARLIARAADRSQVLVVSHASGLIDALQQQPECHSIMLNKTFGQTEVVDADDRPRHVWQWQAR